MEECQAFLRQHAIAFDQYDHPPIATCKEAESLRIDIPGEPTKNLFLREKKGDQFFLVTIGHAKRADLKALSNALECKRLSFGSEKELKQLLGVLPGSVTPLGLMHDTNHHVKYICDTHIWDAERIQCHPCRNDATVVIPHYGFTKFFKITGHEVQVMDVPSIVT